MKGRFKVGIDDYVENMIQPFPQKLKSTYMEIKKAGNNLFENGNGNPLGNHKLKIYTRWLQRLFFY